MPRTIHSVLHRLRWPALVLTLLLAWMRWGTMDPLFDSPHSTVLLDRNGAFLGATVATDGQWRMPDTDSIPLRFEQCLLEFEDRNFRSHWGIHLPSLLRAMKQNYHAGRTVSGGSTITMQVARMAMQHRSRNYFNKLMEMVLAVRLEVRYSKDEILQLYGSNAPFGANVVGLEAASWRWYSRSPDALSWAENALLAVLPNAPSQLHPGQGRGPLKAKRDRLLTRLLQTQVLDSMEWKLALEEPLPNAPRPLPRTAPHLLSTLQNSGLEGKRITSTLNAELQQRCTTMMERYAIGLQANEVHNAAMLVLDVPSGEVLAYVGNLSTAGAQHAGAVDIIQARRSTGSLLKPFLYADMLQSGELMPDQLVADLPTHYDGFAPRNFDDGYDGAVPASQALARSLNIPAVRALHEHGIERTLRTLRSTGLHHVDRSADNYGLSLIIGGAESTLWELTGAYASMARILLNYNGDPGSNSKDIHPPVVTMNADRSPETDGPLALSAGAIHHTIAALQQLNRPDMETGWQHFSGSERIAWKTGTSFGHRDAWAIGVTDRYAVGIWTGNASGEGRPGLTGSLAAAPLLFEAFGALPDGRGFDPPFDDLDHMNICRTSGYRAGVDCDVVDTLWIVRNAARTSLCPYHQRILVNGTSTERVRPGPNAHMKSWFILPPAMEHYYVQTHSNYRSVPPWATGAIPVEGIPQIEMIYPENNARILIPVQLKGTTGRVVLQATHRDPDATLHWDLDGEPIGTTRHEHELTVDMNDGSHALTLTDQYGRKLVTHFTCRVGSSTN